jgi:hypothetical protein
VVVSPETFTAWAMGKLEFGIGYLTTSARAAPGPKTTALKKNAPSESIIACFICCSMLVIAVTGERS